MPVSAASIDRIDYGHSVDEQTVQEGTIEGDQEHTHTTEEEIVWAEEAMASPEDVEALEQLTGSTITESPLNTFQIAADMYEPNDSFSTAFPYSKTVKIDSHANDDFSYGYAYANIHTQGDEDYFSVNLTQGFRYVAAIKNVYNHLREIRGYYQKADGSWWYYHGTPESSSYWFAVECDGKIDERHWVGDPIIEH